MATITRSSLSAIERLALSPGSLLDVKAAASAAPVILALITAARGRAGRGGSRGVDESHEPPDIFAWITAARGRVRRGCVYEHAVSAVSANVTTTCCIVNRAAREYTRSTRFGVFFTRAAPLVFVRACSKELFAEWLRSEIARRGKGQHGGRSFAP